MKFKKTVRYEFDFEGENHGGPDNQIVQAGRIGAGRFTTAYLAENGVDVYLLTRSGRDGRDYSKEILAGLSEGHLPPTHLPAMYHITGYATASGADVEVYRTIYYQPLTAQSKDAWRQFKALRNFAEVALQDAVRQHRGDPYRNPYSFGYECMQHVVDRAREELNSPLLVNALQALADACVNYGSGWLFEFAQRNCAVDGAGNLVLLDCVFDAEQLAHARRRRAVA